MIAQVFLSAMTFLKNGLDPGFLTDSFSLHGASMIERSPFGDNAFDKSLFGNTCVRNAAFTLRPRIPQVFRKLFEAIKLKRAKPRAPRYFVKGIIPPVFIST